MMEGNQEYSMVVPRMISPDEAAEILGINRRTVIKHLKDGSLKGKKLGRLWKISESDLEAFQRTEQPRKHRERRKRQEVEEATIETEPVTVSIPRNWIGFYKEEREWERSIGVTNVESDLRKIILRSLELDIQSDLDYVHGEAKRYAIELVKKYHLEALNTFPLEEAPWTPTPPKKPSVEVKQVLDVLNTPEGKAVVRALVEDLMKEKKP